MQEKITSNCYLPCSGYNNGKRDILYWIFISAYKEHELTGRISVCYSRKTNILDFELRVEPWNYMRAATQMKPGQAKSLQKLFIIAEN